MTTRKRPFRRMGYFRDQDGIMNRYLRESNRWAPHLERTRAFINAAFMDRTPESVAVLGSGWLLDVPLEEMRKRYRKIYLADIRHPPQIRKRVSGMPEVELIETDLTGGAVEQVWSSVRKRKGIDPEAVADALAFSPPLGACSPGAFISVNLLNQLDILVCDYLQKHGPFQQNELVPVRRRLQEDHLSWIGGIPGCLITDTVEIQVDNEGKETHKSLIFCDLPKGLREEEWEWEFDSRQTYRPGRRIRMNVKALEWV